jgi:hypothetical protein
MQKPCSPRSSPGGPASGTAGRLGVDTVGKLYTPVRRECRHERRQTEARGDVRENFPVSGVEARLVAVQVPEAQYHERPRPGCRFGEVQCALQIAEASVPSFASKLWSETFTL